MSKSLQNKSSKTVQAKEYTGDDVKRFINIIQEENRANFKMMCERFDCIQRTLDIHTKMLMESIVCMTKTSGRFINVIRVSVIEKKVAQ
ncbi:MAG: hypothetical protein Q8P86_01530 [bacterium]|nr:hypothetical protein [bacterium]